MEGLERVGANFPALNGDNYVSITAKVGSACVCGCISHPGIRELAPSHSVSSFIVQCKQLVPPLQSPLVEPSLYQHTSLLCSVFAFQWSKWNS